MALASDIARCAVRTCALLARGHLHLDRTHINATAVIPQARAYTIFRESRCDVAYAEASVTLAVWFTLRFVPEGARARRWLFERESICNTLLFAGCEGYVRKLWMVDPRTSEYAGLYTWAGASSAERYGRYITSILRPLSAPGSCGHAVIDDVTVDGCISAGRMR